jgi:signal transduction histidine kinase
MALAIGVALEQENFKEKSMLLQRTALIGQLTRGMVHEINNLVSPLSSRLDNLQFNLKKLEANPNRSDLQEARSHLISSELLEIQKNVRKIITTSQIFGNIAARAQNRVLRVDEIVSQTIHLLTDMANRSHITLVFSPPEQLIVIRSQAAALEQVLLNVMLNASQQIAELRPESGGWLHVRIQPPFQKANAEFFRILIEDNGPGIHSSLWERIFEPGYTTRIDGSGIGLYISRNLLESIGGRLYVLESRILDGTTFALEIPAHL